MIVSKSALVLRLRDGPAPFGAEVAITAAPRDAPLPALPRLPTVDAGALRTSSYVIVVDLETEAGDALIAHGYTGAYDRVSRRVVAYLRSREVSPPPKPLYGTWSPQPGCDGEGAEPASEVIARLTKRGYLTRMTADEEEAYFTRIALRLHGHSHRQRPQFVVMPTYGCNLRCSYCFQNGIRSGGNPLALVRMRREVADRMFGAMRQIETWHAAPVDAPRAILLFGGEPLLAENAPLVRYIVGLALEAGTADIAAVTNGTELRAYADLLGPGKIASLQITVDGVAARHDRVRVHADGRGSYREIAANIGLALSLEVAVNLRVNVDRTSVDGLPALAEEIALQGWDLAPNFGVRVAPIHRDEDRRHGLSSWELARALDALKETHPRMACFKGPDDPILARARRVFNRRDDPFPDFRASFCGAHRAMYVIDPRGDIYACWERTGDPRLRLGRITESGEVVVNPAVLDAWRGRTVVSNPVCRRCRYAVYCGGGCAVRAEAGKGSLHANYCDGYGRRFRAGLAQAYAEHIAGVARPVTAQPLCDV